MLEAVQQLTTSRTGTARYLRNARAVKAKAKRDGIVHCPGYTDVRGVHHPCGVELDYDNALQDNSVEVDHILSPKFGGTDDIDNLTILCRRQNREKGDGSRIAVPIPSADDFPLSRSW